VQSNFAHSAGQRDLLGRVAAHRLRRLRLLRVLLGAAAALAGVLASRGASAATIDVGPSCSFEQAVAALHGNQGTCNAIGDGGGGAGDTIAIPEGSFPINAVNVDIYRSVTIQGAGPQSTFLEVTADAYAGTALRLSGSDVSVTLYNLTLTASGANWANHLAGVEIHGVAFTLWSSTIRSFGDSGIRNFGGSVEVFGSTIEYNGMQGMGSGGGIYNVNSGSVSLWSSRIYANWAWDGGGIYSSDSDTWASYSEVSSNGAMGNGGGIYTYGQSDNQWTNLVIQNNGAWGTGGGVFLANTAVELHECNLSHNSAVNGGGLAVDGSGDSSARVRLEASLIAGNYAQNTGGGVWSTGQLGPGVSNTTVFGNTAATGGGIWHSSSGEFDLDFCTVAGNTATASNGVAGILVENAGQSSFLQNLVARNTVQATGAFSDIAWNGSPSAFRNVIGAGDWGVHTQFPDTSGNLVGFPWWPINPMFALGLQYLGGATEVLALCPGSPALDRINPPDIGLVGVDSADQRGHGYRRAGEFWDVGAFELGPSDNVSMCP
jgi:hypothetical protein